MVYEETLGSIYDKGYVVRVFCHGRVGGPKSKGAPALFVPEDREQ
jgi:hypothetical protein